jgi:cytochrome c5
MATHARTRLFYLCVMSVLLALTSLGAHAALSDRSRAAISERIAPKGTLCEVGQSCAAARSVLTGVAAGDRTGTQVYQSVCFTCHDTGAGGAAKLDESVKWAGKRAARTLEQIYQSAIEGRNAMPARGSCTDCSDEEIKRAVDHMLSRVDELSG